MKQPIKLPPLPPARLEIINMIDILITLIAFFMLTTVFADNNRQLKITPPAAQNSNLPFDTSKLITIGVDKNNHFFINGRSISKVDLDSVLDQLTPDTPVVLQADEQCRFKQVVQLLDQLKNRHLNKIAFVTRKI